MPFRVGRTVSRNASVDGNDTLGVKQALATLGFYDVPEWGLSPWPDEPMFQGITAFQTESGLRADGIITPAGPTEQTLGDRLRARDEALASARRRSAAAANTSPRTRPGSITQLGTPPSLSAPTVSPSPGRGIVMASQGVTPGHGVAWSEGGPITGTTADQVQSASEWMREKVRAWRRDGLNTAADNLDRYLSGIGGTKLYTGAQARRFPQIREAEQENIQRFENGTFRGETVKNPGPRRLKSMQNGQTITFQDEWDSRFEFEEFARDGLFGNRLEMDFAHAHGETNLLSLGHFTATRRGDRIYIQGHVTHFWGTRDVNSGQLKWERYDFHRLQPGAIQARILEKHGNAMPFDFGARWHRQVNGYVPIAHGHLGKAQVTWR